MEKHQQYLKPKAYLLTHTLNHSPQHHFTFSNSWYFIILWTGFISKSVSWSLCPRRCFRSWGLQNKHVLFVQLETTLFCWARNTAGYISINGWQKKLVKRRAEFNFQLVKAGVLPCICISFFSKVLPFPSIFHVFFEKLWWNVIFQSQVLI